jgi:opacity protein-like surface antigen
MKTKAFSILAILMLLSWSGFAQKGEKRFGLEFSGGASWATSQLGGADLSQGFGFEGILHYRFMPHLGMYAGWGWNQFEAETSFAGKNAQFEETGYVFGLQFKHPIGNSPVSWYVRGAGLYNHIEMENTAGDIINDTGHGFGWQAAAGIDLNLGANWSLTPGLKFNSLTRDTDFEEVSRQLKLNYVSARLGILKKF